MTPTLYPTGYGRTLVELDDLMRIHHVDKMHPVFARRLRAWLEQQGGNIGIGGSWRPDGTQPDRPGFAPEGRSFHQYQRFASGLVAFAAVDLVARNGSSVHRAPRWDEVPAQGTPAAAAAGVHANVSSEPWHLQPVELDGWSSWVAAGRPDPITRTLEVTDVNLTPPGTRKRYDSRTAGGPLERLKVHRIAGVTPAGAVGAVVNVTVVDPEAKGYAVVGFDGPTPPPDSSHVNFAAWDNRANAVTVPVAGDGSLQVWLSQRAHLIVECQAVLS